MSQLRQRVTQTVPRTSPRGPRPPRGGRGRAAPRVPSTTRGVTRTVTRAVLALVLGLSLPGRLALATGQTGPAQPDTGIPSWLPGSGAAGESTIVGVLDTAADPAALARLQASSNGLFTLRGWVVDTAADGWSGIDDVRVFLGSMDSGTLLGEAVPAQNRPDVAATLGNPFFTTSGWSMTIDGGLLPPGQDALSINAHTPGKGWWYLQVSLAVGQAAPTSAQGGPLAGAPPSIVVAAPLENQKVSTHLGGFVIAGSVIDPATHSPRTIDWVQVWLNGEQNAPGSSLLGEAAPAPDGTWSLEFNPSRYAPLASNLYVYAHSDVTGRTGLAVVHFDLTRALP